MQAYKNILQDIRQNGELVENRNGYCVSIFGARFRHDLRQGFPLLTLKAMPKVTPLAELFAFLRGETNNQGFVDLGCLFWKPWSLKEEVSSIIPLGRFKIIENAYKAGLISEKTEDAYLAKTNQINTEIKQYGQNRLNAGQEAILAIDTEKAKLQNQIHEHAVGSVEYITLTKRMENLPSDNHAIAYEAINKFMMANPEPKTLEERIQECWFPIREKYIKYQKGALGPIYGAQWINWKTSMGETINQIKMVIDELKEDPASRRIVLTGWNPEFVPPKFKIGTTMSSEEQIEYSIKHGYQALPPCHLMTIFKTTENGRVLNLHQIMRSCDVPIGLPFNIACYGYLLEIMAKQLNMVAGSLLIDITDAHFYDKNHAEVTELLKRDPMPLCRVKIPEGIDITNPDTLTRSNIDKIVESIEGYQSHGKIKMEVSV